MPLVVRVLPDVVAIDKEFDYLVPPGWESSVRVGTAVRVVLAGRRIGGWVTGMDVKPPEGVALSPLRHVSGWGPEAALLDLAGWAAWRWAGQRAHFLRTASAPVVVRTLPRPGRSVPARASASSPGGAAPAPVIPGGAPPAPVIAGGAPPAPVTPEEELAALAADALAGGTRVLRLPPAADPTPVVVAAANCGPTLVLVPALARAALLAARLRRAGRRVALVPSEWAEARAGVDVVVGARAAAWAPCPDLAVVVVIDAHDEAYVEEAAPTWDAVEVARERAQRAGAPCVLISATPTLEMTSVPRPELNGTNVATAPPLVTPSRATERRGWAPLEVIDRRGDDPRLGLWSDSLVAAVAAGGRVACVLNRRGRARLLACASCGELVRCEHCGAAVVEGTSSSKPAGAPRRGVAVLRCPRCETTRPGLCAACGSTSLKRLRLGVTRAAEELSALVGRPVTEVSGPGAGAEARGDLLMGTETVLHRLEPLDAVVFVDFDQELLAPRYRAGEEALAMLGRAARLVGGRRRGGRVLVQTRLPDHPVVAAALHADYELWAQPERATRAALRLPPYATLARISGDGAPMYAASLHAAVAVAAAQGQAAQLLGPADGRWLLKAPSPDELADLLRQVPRAVAAGRLRVEVAPRRV